MLNADCPGCAQARNDLAHMDVEVSRLNLQLREEKKISGAMKQIADNLETERDELRVKLNHVEADLLKSNRLNGELKDTIAQASVALETADCHGKHEECMRCQQIRFLRSKAERPKCDHPTMGTADGQTGLRCVKCGERFHDITEKRNHEGTTTCPHCGALFGCDGKTCARKMT